MCLRERRRAAVALVATPPACSLTVAPPHTLIVRPDQTDRTRAPRWQNVHRATPEPVNWTGITAPNSGQGDSFYVQRYQGATPNPACGSSPTSRRYPGDRGGAVQPLRTLDA